MIISENFNLKKFNTFGMDVKCNIFVQADCNEEIPIIAEKYLKNNRYYILSGGSNTLFTGDFDGIILHLETKGIEIVEENDESVILRASAGEDWDNLIRYCVDNQFYGLENLTAIPGRVGSAPVQNIGAYGVEAKDVILKVYGFNIADNQWFSFSNEECQFGYRTSVFKTNPKQDLIITDVYFQLSKKPKFNLSYKGLSQRLENENIALTIENISDIVKKIRDEKLPDYKKIGNGGSFFKNPVISKSQFENLIKINPDLTHFNTTDGNIKLSAGQLIEKSGWKGKSIGNAGVYEKQALVLVNHGNASPQEILELAAKIVNDVYSMFGVTLEMEINRI